MTRSRGTTTAVLVRTVDWFAARGVTIERFHCTLADGWAYTRCCT